MWWQWQTFHSATKGETSSDEFDDSMKKNCSVHVESEAKAVLPHLQM
jgi:hypothetical protein